MGTLLVRDSKNRRYTTCQVDDCDMDFEEYKWHLSGGGYAYRKTSGEEGQKSVYLHKEILNRMSRSLDNPMGDHIDGDKLNNTRDNLRVATCSQNQHNRRMDKRNSTGYFGVDRSRGKYRAQACENYKHTMLGRYDSAVDAAIVRDIWVAEHRGRFSRMNFSEDFYLKAGIDIFGSGA